MHIVILCGGNGKRMNEYSFPKPLNMVYGKPSIYYTLSKLPKNIDTVHFIVAPHLIEYNFAEIVSNLFPSLKCVFHNLPYFTRGPLESAYLGMKDVPELDTSPVVFLDNDNMHTFPDGFSELKEAFLGYSLDDSDSTSFSFLSLSDQGFVTEYKEKERISNLYCCGVYGFESLKQFRHYASSILHNQLHNAELYMSLLFQYMLTDGIRIKGIHFKDSCHIGSYKELTDAVDANKLAKRQMRICFDLDNTLVTYPVTPGDYSTVKPIASMINLARQLKQDGNTIIIYTARRMQTHHHNVGAVIADIGQTTFKTLNDFDIPYDELIFGKPLADVYIDDRAINPYRNDMQSLGLINYKTIWNPINKIETNANNTIVVEDNCVKKTGPKSFMEGEIYFYMNIPDKIKHLFPEYIKSISKPDSQTSTLWIEQIYGIPFYTLYKNGMITDLHLDKLFDTVDLLHSTSTKQILNSNLSRETIIKNYTDKLITRFKNIEDYPFDDANNVQNACLQCLEKYYKKMPVFQTAEYIHGDLWFSNVIIDFNGNIKLLDMKGRVATVLTTAGDMYYDYGKLYQSILGYDAVLYGDHICPDYCQNMQAKFEQWVVKNAIDLVCLKYVTFSLVMGTFHFMRNDAKKRVWEWIKITFNDIII